MKKIILASSSPRRKEILEKTGLRFKVDTADYREEMHLRKSPYALARYLSRKKAESLVHKYKNALIIASDTFIVVGKKLIGKPSTKAEAGKILRTLSGRAHSVITGFTIIDTSNRKCVSRSVETKVCFRKLGRREIDSYISSGEPLDKAGAYAVQGLGALFVRRIDGDYFNVVGLPLSAVVETLKKFGVRVF